MTGVSNGWINLAGEQLCVILRGLDAPLNGLIGNDLVCDGIDGFEPAGFECQSLGFMA